MSLNLYGLQVACNHYVNTPTLQLNQYVIGNLFKQRKKQKLKRISHLIDMFPNHVLHPQQFEVSLSNLRRLCWSLQPKHNNFISFSWVCYRKQTLFCNHDRKNNCDMLDKHVSLSLFGMGNKDLAKVQCTNLFFPSYQIFVVTNIHRCFT